MPRYVTNIYNDTARSFGAIFKLRFGWKVALLALIGCPKPLKKAKGSLSYIILNAINDTKTGTGKYLGLTVTLFEVRIKSKCSKGKL